MERTSWTHGHHSHALQSIVSPSSRSASSTFFWYISDWFDITARGVFLSDAGSCRRRRQIFARGWIASRWPLRCRRSLLHSRRAVAVHGGDLTNRRRPLSVDPRNGYPLRCRVHALDRGLQLSDRFVEIVVHDGQIEEMPVCLLQHVRFLRQSFQTTVELKTQAILLEESEWYI